MIRFVIAAAALAAVASPVLAQSTTRSTTTTTVTEEGNTTTVRSTTRETTVGVDGEALLGALVGAVAGAAGDRGVWLPQGEPAQAEDVFGPWAVRDREGRAGMACTFEMAERGLLGGRGIRARDCYGLQVHYYRMAGGEVVVFANPSVEVDRLRKVGDVFVGRRLMLTRPGAPEPEWTRDWAQSGLGRPDYRGGGWSGGWGRRLEASAVAGAWRSTEDRNGMRRECRITLGEEPRFSGNAISSSGCFGDLMSVAYWRLEDGRVAIYRPGGALLVMLSGDGRRLSGQGPSGEIVLYR